jgi:hypothetical protein
LLTFLWQCFPGHPIAGKELELSRWAFGVHRDPFVQEQELRIARKVSSYATGTTSHAGRPARELPVTRTNNRQDRRRTATEHTRRGGSSIRESRLASHSPDQFRRSTLRPNETDEQLRTDVRKEGGEDTRL